MTPTEEEAKGIHVVQGCQSVFRAGSQWLLRRLVGLGYGFNATS